MDFNGIVNTQRQYFLSGKTRSVDFRLNALTKLQQALQNREQTLNAALKSDLNKSPFEAFMTETGGVITEISYLKKHLKKWARIRGVKTPLSQFAAKSFVVPDPYGVVLIMAPWNYPLQLCLEPLAGAIAAGNCAVVKPSAYAPATSQAVADIIADIYPPEYVTVVQGGRKENANLLEERFDYIFFTGSTSVGRLVMEAAAKHLTPVSLELGGKSPVIVDETADIKLAAKRIAFGKYLNAGQTCVAPDYVLVHSSVKDRLEEEIGYYIKEFFGEKPLENENLPRIISEKHFDRLLGLMKSEKIFCGGGSNQEKLRIEPTVLTECGFEDAVMGEEIFGPILPVIAYENLDTEISRLQQLEKPLALYLFTSSKETQKKVLGSLSFGGGCINDTTVHPATSEMGFGGVGASGMGSYHGKRSFDTFTHYKSIMDKKTWMDLPMRYHPYSEKNMKLLHSFLK